MEIEQQQQQQTQTSSKTNTFNPLSVTSISCFSSLPSPSVLHVLALVHRVASLTGPGAAASAIIGDKTCKYMTLTIWPDKAHWVKQITAGDVFLFEGLLMSRFRGAPRLATRGAARITRIKAAASQTQQIPKQYKHLEQQALDLYSHFTDVSCVLGVSRFLPSLAAPWSGREEKHSISDMMDGEIINMRATFQRFKEHRPAKGGPSNFSLVFLDVHGQFFFVRVAGEAGERLEPNIKHMKTGDTVRLTNMRVQAVDDESIVLHAVPATSIRAASVDEPATGDPLTMGEFLAKRDAFVLGRVYVRVLRAFLPPGASLSDASSFVCRCCSSCGRRVSADANALLFCGQCVNKLGEQPVSWQYKPIELELAEAADPSVDSFSLMSLVPSSVVPQLFAGISPSALANAPYSNTNATLQRMFLMLFSSLSASSRGRPFNCLLARTQLLDDEGLVKSSRTTVKQFNIL